MAGFFNDMLDSFNPFAPAKQTLKNQFGFFQSPEQQALREQMNTWMQGQLPQTTQAQQQAGGYQSTLAPMLQTATNQYQNPFSNPQYQQGADSISKYLGNQFDTRVAPQIKSGAASGGMTGSSGEATSMGQAGNDMITSLGAILSQLGLSQQGMGAQTMGNTFQNLQSGLMNAQNIGYNPLSQFLKIGQLLPQLQQTGATGTSRKEGDFGNIGGLAKIISLFM